MKWCHEQSHNFANAPNEWTQIEHNMEGRRAAWSLLWWWSCLPCHCGAVKPPLNITASLYHCRLLRSYDGSHSLFSINLCISNIYRVCCSNSSFFLLKQTRTPPLGGAMRNAATAILHIAADIVHGINGYLTSKCGRTIRLYAGWTYFVHIHWQNAAYRKKLVTSVAIREVGLSVDVV